MGYSSTLNGSFEILPAPRLSDYDQRKLEADSSVRWGWECVSVELAKETNTTTEEDGTEVTRSRVIAAHINATCTGDHKHYYMEEILQAVVRMFGKDRQYKGYFEFHGEDGEQWRLGIVNGEVKSFKPVITWPAEVR